MLTCCNRDFYATYSFYVQDENSVSKRIEFAYCPHCNKAIYKEVRIDFVNNKRVKILKRHEAQRAFQRAMFNRLVFISKVKQGSHSKQHWCYGDFKDNKGVQFQIKRNMNGEEVENFGVSEVVLR